LICNIADTPPCDYYLGGIVTKGNVKLRFRQTGNHQLQPSDCEFFEEVIPEDINKMVENLNEYRKTLKEILKKSSKNE
jgi:precorrin-2 dehydrogenase/sirohydrochlorin ferrochelatase